MRSRRISPRLAYGRRNKTEAGLRPRQEAAGFEAAAPVELTQRCLHSGRACLDLQQQVADVFSYSGGHHRVTGSKQKSMEGTWGGGRLQRQQNRGSSPNNETRLEHCPQTEVDTSCV